MTRLVTLLLMLTIGLILGCEVKPPADRSAGNNELSKHFNQYSQSVKDTFYIDIRLPSNYFEDTQRRYPVVIVLDGNFYFPMMESVTEQYAIAGLLDQRIVVGVGYKSFIEMDSLRVRDYLYPKPLPSDELTSGGGGLNFYNYLTSELLPLVKSQYRTEDRSCSLLGHSFGGYFVLFALLTDLKNNKSNFNTFISASPTLWYNNFYLNQLPERLSKENRGKLNLLMTVGTLEDSAWSVSPVEWLGHEIERLNIKDLQFRIQKYDHLNHMDVPLISFTKGLREFTVARDSVN